jgi:hypothetical protein
VQRQVHINMVRSRGGVLWIHDGRLSNWKN